jgi:competence protein ComEA
MKKLLLAAALLLPLACLALDVNQATEAELDSIKGLGPSSTARILKAREAGPFKDWADFMQRVKGIKPATAKKLSDGGLAVGDSPYP